jgi:hypothetical protein
MDLSKLPKLSGEAPADPPAIADPPPSLADNPPARAVEPLTYAAAVSAPFSAAADIWVSLIIGLLLLYVGRSFAQFALASMTGKPFHTGVEWTAGAAQTGEVPYFQLEGYTAWSDTGIFLFGLVLLLDAIVLALTARIPGRARPVLWFAAAMTAACVLSNAILCVLMFSAGITPLASVVAVAVGGWIFLDQWRLLRSTAFPHARPAA